MDRSPLVSEQIEAGAELARRFHQYAPVAVAFWLHVSDDEPRYLYLASSEFDDGNLDRAYGEIVRLARAMPKPNLDAVRVKVVGSAHPFARAALEIAEQFPALLPFQTSGAFGGTVVDELYIYPPPADCPVPPSTAH